MKKNVIISLTGSQSLSDNLGDRLELITEGQFYKDENEYFISYNETEVTGMEGTTTTLKVSQGAVTLIRHGAVNSHLEFRKGEKCISYYETEYGGFTVGVFTRKMDIDIDDYGGSIEIGYNVEIDNNNTGDNDFHMIVREAGGNNGRYN